MQQRRGKRDRIGPGAGFLDAINETLGLKISKERLPEIEKIVKTNWGYYAGMDQVKLDKKDDPYVYLGLMAALGEEPE